MATAAPHCPKRRAFQSRATGQGAVTSRPEREWRSQCVQERGPGYGRCPSGWGARPPERLRRTGGLAAVPAGRTGAVGVRRSSVLVRVAPAFPAHVEVEYCTGLPRRLAEMTAAARASLF